MIHRWLELFFKRPSLWFVRIDTDTRFDRRFRYLPRAIGPQIFGVTQTKFRSIQGGCILFSREAAQRLYDSQILLSTQLLDCFNTWGRYLPRDMVIARVEKGMAYSDWVLQWAREQVGVGTMEFREIWSTWTQGHENLDLRYAVVHPDKEMA